MSEEKAEKNKGGRPRRPENTIPIHVVVSAEIGQKFKAAASRRGLSQRVAIERALELWASPKKQKAISAYEQQIEEDLEDED